MGQITRVTQDAKAIDRIQEVQTEIINDLAKTARGRGGKGVPQTPETEANPAENTIDLRKETETLTIIEECPFKTKLQQVHVFTCRLPSYVEAEQKYRQF